MTSCVSVIQLNEHEAAQSIAYVDMVVQESIRMYPAAPMYALLTCTKTATTDFSFTIEQQEKLLEILK